MADLRFHTDRLDSYSESSDQVADTPPENGDLRFLLVDLPGRSHKMMIW